MNGQVVRTTGGAPRSWRMRQWPNDPTVAHLVFLDHLHVPTPDVLDDALEHARRRGARAVRTSALFPKAAGVAIGAGFRPIDRLALLQRRLDDEPPPPSQPVRPLRPWQHRRAAAVDRAAFGPLWGNDTASLHDIRTATPHHRARRIGDRWEVAGFAVSGAAGEQGYLQRLAVAPGERRQGIARDLVLDALTWMRSRHLDRVLVNTGVDNDGALALYDGLGFERTPDVLTIAELSLDR